MSSHQTDRPSERVRSPDLPARPLLLAEVIDRLCAVLAGTDVDVQVQKLLELFAEAAAVDVAVLCLREGDLVRPRGAVGLRAEWTTDCFIPLGQALSRAPLEAEASPFPFSGALHGISLMADGALVGMVYLGLEPPHALSEEQLQLLNTLARSAAAVLVRQNELNALRQAVRARDEVLGIVAHDLRNPINVISLAANSLLHRLPDASSRRPVERIIRGVQRADRLIQDLLDINAIQGERFSIQTHPVETADMILAAVESQQSLAANASIIIATDLSPELPPIAADEERVVEVLENLVGNAVKFTSPGGSVTVGASGQEGEVLFWVKDSGTGIPAEQMPHLFDRFWQASKKDRRGTGLGLSICKAIVEAHGGRIWVETQVGKGTTMLFTIPAIVRASNDERLEVANLLLVDDRPENLLSLKAILDRPEYRLVTARSGEEALRVALREEFSVALIDIAMPIMNGLEVAIHFKELERSRDIPIIFITAFGDDPQEIHRAYSAGGADYLVKPLDAEIVRKKVAVFVDLSRRRLGTERQRKETKSLPSGT